METSKINSVSSRFNMDHYLKARQLTIEAIHEVAEQVRPGFTEEMGIELIEAVLGKKGYKKFWHPHKFRIGKNTTCSFRDKSEQGVTLQAEDIFFIDIGPIFFDHESDYGKTFTLGANTQHIKIAQAAEALFMECQSLWGGEGLNGRELYEFAKVKAHEMGYLLEDRMCGHRLGDFPHALHYKGRMNQVEAPMVDKLWVLEILLIDKEKKFGAFFEDILKSKLL